MILVMAEQCIPFVALIQTRHPSTTLDFPSTYTSTPCSTRLDLFAIHLLGTPALVGLAHVRWGFDGWDEFQHQVSDTGEANKRTGNVPQHAVMQQDRSDKDIDWIDTDQPRILCQSQGLIEANLQTPRPKKEKRNEA